MRERPLAIYEPPAVGAMLASSAMEAMVIMKQIHTAMVHHISPAVPPLYRPNQLLSNVHLESWAKRSAVPQIEGLAEFDSRASWPADRWKSSRPST